MEKTKRITLEQVYAGGLLIFDEIDDYLLNGIIDFLGENGIEVETPLNYRFKQLYNFSKTLRQATTKNGHSISFKNGHSRFQLDDYGQKIVQESLKTIAGQTLTDFFTAQDANAFLNKMKASVSRVKAKILSDARVLIVSDKQEDYEAFKEYGFKNISFFKSLVRASKYFEGHYGEFRNFQIFVLGNNIAHREDICDGTALESYIQEYKKDERILEVKLYDFSDREKKHFLAFLNGYLTWKSLSIERDSYKDLLDAIVRGAKWNDVLSTVDPKKKLAPLPEDYPPTEPLPLPENKKDLRILCLPITNVPKEAKDIAKNLGLNVTYLSDHNYSFRGIVERLSDYDIVIGSEMYSNKIPYSAVEATEQCKDTGRRETLLISYDTATIITGREVGKDKTGGLKVDLCYAFGGLDYLDANDSSRTIQKVEFTVPDVRYTDESDFYNKTQCLALKTILEAATTIYNRKLESIAVPLADFDITPYEEYTREFEKQRQEELARIKKLNEGYEETCRFIGVIDSIAKFASAYLELCSNGRATKLKDIEIKETECGIRIKISLNGRPLSALTISKSEVEGDTRVFALELTNKRGLLASPKTLAVSTRGLPRNSTMHEPDKKEQNIVESIAKKLSYAIEPQIKREAPKNGRNITPVSKKQ